MSIKTKCNDWFLMQFSCFLVANLFIFIPQVCADTVYLKNGRSIEGFVISEENGRIGLDVGFGVVTLEPQEIEQVYKTNNEESFLLREKWKEEKARLEKIRQEEEKKRDEELERIKQEEEKRPKEIGLEQSQGHIIVDALLNNKVRAQLLFDTGASFVVLTESISQDLGIDIAKQNKIVKLEVADGRKVDAKYAVLKSVSIEGVEAQDVEAAIIPKESVTANFKDGVLGMSFLKRFNFKVDQDKKKIILEKYTVPSN